MRITFIAPARHIQIRGDLPEHRGVGGGITALIRVARALADLGHTVTVIAHVPVPHTHAGVRYISLDAPESLETDVLIVTITAPAWEPELLTKWRIPARLCIAWIHGAELHAFPENPDVVYVPSHFLRSDLPRHWPITRTRLWVTPNGVPDDWPDPDPLQHTGDTAPLRLVYVGTPAKGCDAAVRVTQRLRAMGLNVELHVYGGGALYGQSEPSRRSQPPGTVFHGTVPQPVLYRRLSAHTFALFLQHIQDAFGLALLETMRAGVIPIASSVGAYPELVRSGWNGFLIEGDPLDDTTIERAAALIRFCTDHPEYMAYMREQARRSVIWTWSRTARAWTVHWQILLGRTVPPEIDPQWGVCPECGGPWWALADGYHCGRCGRYQSELQFTDPRVVQSELMHLRRQAATWALIERSRGFRLLRKYWQWRQWLRDRIADLRCGKPSSPSDDVP